MEINPGSFIRSTLLLLPAIVLILVVSIANGQTVSSGSGQEEVAEMNPSASNAAATSLPVFTDYRGVTIGMTAEEVRSKLDGLKKGESQDFLVFSDRESAQIYYNSEGKVTAISIDYFGGNSNAPSPDAVLGVGLVAKADGSMYQLNRYPEAGYWVSYNRTAGDKPIVTITMQKM
ncbi:MAG TPA: hypothetical protein VFT44_23820 [Pyrinomonadaceae bacterium]|nr:hypothetical protein [Pyrinomonadaceae bacterium]